MSERARQAVPFSSPASTSSSTPSFWTGFSAFDLLPPLVDFVAFAGFYVVNLAVGLLIGRWPALALGLVHVLVNFVPDEPPPTGGSAGEVQIPDLLVGSVTMLIAVVCLATGVAARKIVSASPRLTTANARHAGIVLLLVGSSLPLSFLLDRFPSEADRALEVNSARPSPRVRDVKPAMRWVRTLARGRAVQACHRLSPDLVEGGGGIRACASRVGALGVEGPPRLCGSWRVGRYSTVSRVRIDAGRDLIVEVAEGSRIEGLLVTRPPGSGARRRCERPSSRFEPVLAPVDEGWAWW